MCMYVYVCVGDLPVHQWKQIEVIMAPTSLCATLPATTAESVHPESDKAQEWGWLRKATFKSSKKQNSSA